MTEAIPQFLRFCIVGTVGFLVDAAGLYVIVSWFSVGPFVGRIISYVIAATVTWTLNRSYTFKIAGRGAQLHHEWIIYVLTNGVGAIVNYFVYVLFVLYFDLSDAQLVIGVAAGSIAGLAFNFTANKWFVFRHQKEL